jgi:hypothetical protein
VIVCGSDRPLLNWVAFALASVSDPAFIWTDIRLEGEVLADTDPLSRRLIPRDRLNVVRPSELERSDPTVVEGSVVRADEPPETLRRLVDFLRLPVHTQRLLSGGPPGGQPMVLVLSNAQRIVALYPTTSDVAPTVRAIVETGTTLIMTFADAAPEGRLAFETVLHLEGTDARKWREAGLRAEKGPSPGPLGAGTRYRLGEFEPVATILSRHLD